MSFVAWTLLIVMVSKHIIQLTTCLVHIDTKRTTSKKIEPVILPSSLVDGQRQISSMQDRFRTCPATKRGPHVVNMGVLPPALFR